MQLYPASAITAYALVLVAVVGLILGGILTCWARRIAYGESVPCGRLRCDSCGHALGLCDSVPVFGWLACKGRCRWCGGKISIRYPLAELLCAAVLVSLMMRYGIGLEAFELIVFAAILLTVSLVDIDAFVIPNGAIIAAFAVRAIYIAAAGVLYGLDMGAMMVESAIGAATVLVLLLIVVLIAEKVLGRDSMGGGDLKLFAVAGFYFGWQQCLFLIIAACIIGIAFGLAFGSRKSVGRARGDDALARGRTAAHGLSDSSEGESEKAAIQRPFPFGPSIALSCWITMLCGAPFISWYLGLL